VAKARILAIDDQLYFRSFLESLLRAEGYQVATAADAAGGLAALEAGGVDLVLMDLVMPEARGLELVTELRARWPELPLIVVTSVGDVRAVVGAMQGGAQDYLLKPIDRDTLLRSIERVLEQHRAQAENAKLLDENLAILGRLALYERALALFEPLQREPLESALAERLCVEAEAAGVRLFVPDPEEGALRLRAVHGDPPEGDAEAPVPGPEHEEAWTELRAGRTTRSSEGALWLPFFADRQLVGVAELWPRPEAEFAPRQIDAARALARIGTLALRSASRGEPGAVALRDAQTGLPARAYLEQVLRTEVHKAERYGRRLSLVCAELGDEIDALARDRAVEAMARTLRTTDILCAENASRFWILLTDTDAMGGVVLKRRVSDRILAALAEAGASPSLRVGVASYPQTGDSAAGLLEAASAELDSEGRSAVRELGITSRQSFAEMGQRMRSRAARMAHGFPRDVAEILLLDLGARPRDRGLLFLAPGDDRAGLLAPLGALGETASATEVYLAVDGDTLPAGPALTAVALPPRISPDETWIVRFGEAPPYAMVAGPAREDGTRDVFHSSDPVLVEHLAFRLRAEVGLGVSA
jgi:DNA-binding response OmpR family regulator/GGDEF domain-containing protein